jgi:hypothetical protein
MSTTKALSGFRPSRIRGSGVNSTGVSEYRIASGTTGNIFTGDLVKNVAGNIEVITSIDNRTVGVFMGCNYVQDGEPKWSSYWPSATSATDARAMVMDDPQATFTVQADASVTVGDINSKNFDVTLGSGSTYTGRSGFGIKAASRTGASAMARVISVLQEPGNNIDTATERAFPKLEVRLVQSVDAYVTVSVAS